MPEVGVVSYRLGSPYWTQVKFAEWFGTSSQALSSLSDDMMNFAERAIGVAGLFIFVVGSRKTHKVPMHAIVREVTVGSKDLGPQ